ncbi:MAG: hypothetical protein H6992_06050 [Pseudomonadales bacterium]|nr:hypothetical protein [Pseudomonadales bacterium]
MEKRQIHLFETKDELLAAATEQADRVQIPELHHSTELYYVARYFVAVFESRNGEIPIQVWNEYRNALDHYFRHITDSYKKTDTDRKSHLAKMEGHLQRAVLDVLKLLCHKTQEAIWEEKNKHLVDILRLVDSGEFVEKFNTDHNAAVELFSFAKISDLNLGDDAVTNTEIVGHYLDAAFAFDALRRLLIDNENKIERARSAHNDISGRAKKLSAREDFALHLLVYVFVFCVGLFFNYVKTPVVNAFNDIVDNQAQQDSLEPDEVDTNPKTAPQKIDAVDKPTPDPNALKSR